MSAILNAAWARGMHEAIQAGDHELALAISAHIDDFLHQIFGGPVVRFWMGELKYCLHRMGIFSHTTSYLDMDPDEQTIETIDALVSGRFWEFDAAKARALISNGGFTKTNAVH